MSQNCENSPVVGAAALPQDDVLREKGLQLNCRMTDILLVRATRTNHTEENRR